MINEESTSTYKRIHPDDICNFLNQNVAIIAKPVLQPDGSFKLGLDQNRDSIYDLDLIFVENQTLISDNAHFIELSGVFTAPDSFLIHESYDSINADFGTLLMISDLILYYQTIKTVHNLYPESL